MAKEPQSKYRVEMIDPVLAASYLQLNTDNRPLREHHVFHLATSMDNDEWEENGETLKFDIDGRLIDGQHRLRAVVLSGKTVPMGVIRGLPTTAFATIDTGRPRSTGDVLSLKGHKMPNNLASILRTLDTHLRGLAGHSTMSFTHKQCLALLEEYPETKSYAERAGQFKAVGNASLLCTYWFLAHRAQGSKVDTLFRQISQGAGLQEGDPALTLRERLIADRVSKTKLRRSLVPLYVIRAINAFVENRPLLVLRSIKGEAWPRLRGDQLFGSRPINYGFESSRNEAAD